MASFIHEQAIRLFYGTDPEQFGELFLPPGSGPHPVVVLLHGGFWRNRYGLSLMMAAASDLTQRGIAAWNVEYRRVGDPGGGWPGTLQDIAHATDYLQQLAASYPLDVQRIITVGHSAGGQLALWLAARSRIGQKAGAQSAFPNLFDCSPVVSPIGAISLAGMCDLVEAWKLNVGDGVVTAFLGGSPESVPERYAQSSPAALLPMGVPQILIHGTEDPHVPIALSRTYLAAAQEAGDRVNLIELPGIGHSPLKEPGSVVWPVTVEAIQHLLEP
ncbi:MAG: alpha/beta hydrolase [Ktedonobacteraceae bacterium]